MRLNREDIWRDRNLRQIKIKDMSVSELNKTIRDLREQKIFKSVPKYSTMVINAMLEELEFRTKLDKINNDETGIPR